MGWEATDGNYDADKAVIRPEAKRLLRWEMGGVIVTVLEALTPGADVYPLSPQTLDALAQRAEDSCHRLLAMEEAAPKILTELGL